MRKILTNGCCDYLSNKDHTQLPTLELIEVNGCDYLSNKDHTQL